ncbi:MAG: hypothetical protein K9L68_00465 [Spirochaetales bacterium]|nr:hypothetical protein [Spirochaetales bacterium]MCF7937049.1 hypothetical protein [Spirochaetales bacterium]
MRVEQSVMPPIQNMGHREAPRFTLIEARDMKALLYVGIRGEISLPVEKHTVDTFA